VTPDHEVLHPTRRIVRIQRERVGLGQEGRENDPGLEPSKWCAHAMVNTPSECDMASRNFAIENNVVPVFERR
jgi:hypothetical protein